ncbi:hypothetical protein [Paenibacillus contaminans]|uniref:DUF4878 domain-containing protein n=1 Tax=Paenibacillus contaminans TaxID=450362 RepID=A0A329MPT8_9BACL|nr:hypothetical protein [Paenibacillus contaminans]RAV21905.1 hypothetical protein DQG23_07575 [Paenibacillus contaminans]
MTKSFSKILKSVLSLVLVLCFINVSVQAEKNNEKLSDPYQVIENYFVSVKNGDIDSMVANSIDLNYSDEITQREEYAQYHKTVPLRQYKINSSKTLDPLSVQFQVVLSYDDVGTLPEITYTVIKKNGSWKVLIEPIEINLDPNSPDYQKVSQGKPKNQIKYADLNSNVKTTETTAPLTVGLDDYRIINLIYNESVNGIDTFSTSQGQVLFHGWQERVNLSCTTCYVGTVKYEVIVITGSSTVSLGSGTVSGEYLSSGTWYSTYASVSNGSNRRVRITNQGMADINGAGDVYE